MKRYILVLTAVLISTITNAQFQVSASSGYAVGSAGMKLGETVNLLETENSFGSYGEGVNFQLRGTYFFNETFGVDLGVGYLQGTDKTISKVNLPNASINAIARARAFGASTSIVYKFTNKIYGRFGALIKVGGKTEALVYNKSVFSEQEAQTIGLPLGSYSETNYIENFHGVFPLGFVGALGYTFDLNSNFSVFAEAEYYGISLKRKNSEIVAFNTDFVLADGTVAASSVYALDNLPNGYTIETTYVDNLPNSNTDSSKELGVKVPYSSFGINIGITYRFRGSGEKSSN